MTYSDNDVDLDAVRLHKHVGVLDQLKTDRASVVSLNSKDTGGSCEVSGVLDESSGALQIQAKLIDMTAT